MAEPLAHTKPQLVPASVSERKLGQELQEWAQHEEAYLRRGWRLRRLGPLTVEVLFLASVPMDPNSTVHVVAPCVHLHFDNYDLHAPSVVFVDPLTAAPFMPPMGAVLSSEHGDRNVLLAPHPVTGGAFLCLPGVREYHDHPQHNGDSWLLHRGRGDGRLAVICERIWRAMPRTIIGVSVMMRWTPPVNELQVRLVQGKPEALAALATQLGGTQSEPPITNLAEQGLQLAAQVIDPVSGNQPLPQQQGS